MSENGQNTGVKQKNGAYPKLQDSQKRDAGGISPGIHRHNKQPQVCYRTTLGTRQPKQGEKKEVHQRSQLMQHPRICWRNFGDGQMKHKLNAGSFRSGVYTMKQVRTGSIPYVPAFRSKVLVTISASILNRLYERSGSTLYCCSMVLHI